MELEFSPQIFEETGSIKFHDHLSKEAVMCPTRKDRQTDRHTRDTNTRFSLFCECAYKPKINIMGQIKKYYLILFSNICTVKCLLHV